MTFDCIEPSSTKLKNVNFITGVAKIQNNQITLMNDLEHNACSRLLISEGSSSLEAEDTNEVAFYEARREMLKCRKLGNFSKQSSFFVF